MFCQNTHTPELSTIPPHTARGRAVRSPFTWCTLGLGEMAASMEVEVATVSDDGASDEECDIGEIDVDIGCGAPLCAMIPLETTEYGLVLDVFDALPKVMPQTASMLPITQSPDGWYFKLERREPLSRLRPRGGRGEEGGPNTTCWIEFKDVPECFHASARALLEIRSLEISVALDGTADGTGNSDSDWSDESDGDDTPDSDFCILCVQCSKILETRDILLPAVMCEKCDESAETWACFDCANFASEEEAAAADPYYCPACR